MKPIARLIVSFLAFFPAYALIPVDFVHASSVNCYCVLFLREVLGVDIHGNADTILPNIPAQYVEVGDVVLFHYTEVDHAALITSIVKQDGVTGFIISESNFHHCKPGTRFVPFNDPTIRGIYRPTF